MTRVVTLGLTTKFIRIGSARNETAYYNLGPFRSSASVRFIELGGLTVTFSGGNYTSSLGGARHLRHDVRPPVTLPGIHRALYTHPVSRILGNTGIGDSIRNLYRGYTCKNFVRALGLSVV